MSPFGGLIKIQGELGGPQKGARKFVHFTCAPYITSRGPRRPSEGGSKIRAFHIAPHEPLWRAPKNSRGARWPSEGGSKIRAFHIAPHEPLWRAPKNSRGARRPSEGGSKIRAFHMSPLCALKGRKEALRRGLENSCISHEPPMCPQGVLGGPQKEARKFVHFICAPYVPSRGPRRPSEGGSKIRAFHIAPHEPLWRAPKNSRGARRPSEGGSKIRAFHMSPLCALKGS